MSIVARCYARLDEKQFVFVIEDGHGFMIVEVAELWEEPQVSTEGACYFCYPTVIGNERYRTLEATVAEVLARYPWADQPV